MPVFPTTRRNAEIPNCASRQRIREARWSLRRQRFVTVAAWLLAGGITASALWNIASFAFPDFAPITIRQLPAIIGLALSAGALCALASWRASLPVARRMDRSMDTKDRFVSLLALRNESCGALIERDVEAYSRTLRLPASLGPKLPLKPLALTAISLLLLIGISVMESHRRNQLAPELAAARHMLDAASKTLRDQTVHDQKLEEIEKKLEEVLRELPRSSEPHRDALRAMTEMERRLSSSGEASGKPLSAEDAAALADALVDENPSLAAAVASGPAAQTAQMLSALDPAALARALDEAARHTKSARLREMARQSDQEAHQQLAAIYRYSGDTASDTASRNALLQALRDMKSGASPEENSDSSRQGIAFAPSEAGTKPPLPSEADKAPPGGAPGSDKDRGQGPDIQAGDTPPDLPDKQGEHLAGSAGQGPSITRVLSAQDNDETTARHRPTGSLDPTQAAALDAITQENIPPGSRILVRRYFEAIRPQE